MRILRQHLRQEAGALAGWGVTVLAVAALLTGLFGLMASRRLLQPMHQIVAQMPPQMQQLLGGGASLGTLGGWLDGVLLSGWEPMLVGVWVALAVVGVVTADADSGTLEFVLALPVARGRLLAERACSVLLQLLLLQAATWAGAVSGLAIAGQPTHAGRLAAALGAVSLAQAALAGMLLLLSLAFRDQAAAVLATVTGALVLVLLPVLVPAGGGVGWLREFSPFRYDAVRLAAGAAFPWGDAALLAAWAAAAFAAAAAVFSRQEV